MAPAPSPPAYEEAAQRVSDTLAADGRVGSAELLDLLRDAPRQHQYFVQHGRVDWPPLVRSVRAAGLPPVVVQRYDTRQSVCFCGVFAEIGRAWATVDNTLFMWRFDRPDDVPVEYSGEEQAIVGVGLATPVKGVFMESITHLLVLATPVEIVLLGVSLYGGELSHPVQLPGYSCPTDDIVMTSIVSSDNGRIFMAGGDGNLYELVYGTSDGWFNRRCRKVCIAGQLGRLVPRVLRFGTPDSLKQVLVDDSRHILYTRSQAGVLCVYDLGAKGDQAPHKVAEIADASRGVSGSGGFGFGSSTSKMEAARRAIVHIAVVTPAESSRLTLVAVCADGRRIYFTTLPETSAFSFGTQPQGNKRPTQLKAMYERDPPPQASALGQGGADQLVAATPTRALEVEAAFYTGGVLLLSDATQTDDAARLFLTGRDVTLPPHFQGGHYVAPSYSTGGLRESVAIQALEGRVTGPTGAIGEVPPPASVTALLDGSGSATLAVARGELSTQHAMPPRRFVVMTTVGLLELEKSRPVDVLQHFLEQGAPAQLEEFFKSYGAAETSAMCVILATACAGAASVPTSTSSLARDAFANSALAGEPRIADAPGGVGAPHGGSFEMGYAVNNPQLFYSGAHDGLYLHVSRVLRVVWDASVAADRGGGQLKSTLNAGALSSLEAAIRPLDRFLTQGHWRRGTGPPLIPGDSMFEGGNINRRLVARLHKRVCLEDAAASGEERSVSSLVVLLRRTMQTLTLLQTLLEYPFNDVVQKLPEEYRKSLVSMKFKDLVASPQGDEIVRRLVAALMSYHTVDKHGSADALSNRLQASCPSYFGEAEHTFYRARETLAKARQAQAAKRPEAEITALAREALDQLLRVPLSADLEAVCAEFMQLRYWEGLVELPLRRASAEDPAGHAFLGGGDDTHLHAVAARDACYTMVTDSLRALTSLKDAPAVQAVVSVCARSGDRLFQERLYEVMLELNLERELLTMSPAHLEAHLARTGGLTGLQAGSPVSASQARRLELLAKLYVQRKRHSNAACVLELLALRQSAPGEAPVPLQERRSHLSVALLHAKSSTPQPTSAGAGGADQLTEQLDGQLRVLDFQLRIHRELSARGPEWQAGRETLESAPLPLSTLWEEFAQPAQLWDVCLGMLHFARHTNVDQEQARQLWDAVLRQAVVGAGSSEGALPNACAVVRRLGKELFPSEVAFPLPHVLLRLELLAAGVWGDTPGAAADQGAIAATAVAACKGAPEPVLRAYDSLLQRTVGELASPPLRAQLLRSALLVLREWAEPYLSSSAAAPSAYLAPGGRSAAPDAGVRGVIHDLCDRFVVDFVRPLGDVLPAEKDALVSGFYAVRDGFRRGL